ncbi:MAG: hypothetical protein ACREBR_02060, partial [bacterium]
HQYLITEYPSFVHSYEQFDDSNPFDPVRLQGAVEITTEDTGTLGKLTAIVRYYTPYCDNTGAPVVIAFALGDDVSVNTIIGWPTIEALQIDILTSIKMAISHVIRERFSITRREAQHGLPSNSRFAKEDFQRPTTQEPPIFDSDDAIHAYAATIDPPTHTSDHGSTTDPKSNCSSRSYCPHSRGENILL